MLSNALFILTLAGFESTGSAQAKLNLKDHCGCKLSMYPTCYDSIDTCILMQTLKRQQANARTHTHASTVEETLPLQAHFSSNEWNRSRSKLINVPTAPERFLVRWQQCLFSGDEY